MKPNVRLAPRSCNLAPHSGDVDHRFRDADHRFHGMAITLGERRSIAALGSWVGGLKFSMVLGPLLVFPASASEA